MAEKSSQLNTLVFDYLKTLSDKVAKQFKKQVGDSNFEQLVSMLFIVEKRRKVLQVFCHVSNLIYFFHFSLLTHLNYQNL